MSVSRLYRISETLYDESYDIAAEHSWEVSDYAGRAARVLNLASAAGICASSKLIVDNHTLELPRLSKVQAHNAADDLVFFDIRFPELSDVETFEDYAAVHSMRPDRRLERALTLTNHILSHVELGQPMHFYNPAAGTRTPVRI
jgi:hypothetical protein